MSHDTDGLLLKCEIKMIEIYKLLNAYVWIFQTLFPLVCGIGPYPLTRKNKMT